MKKSRLILIVLSALILLGCISMTVFLLFFNYRNIRLFKQAQRNFLRGDEESLTLAETQLQQFIRKDSDHEAAFSILGEIARKRKVYPEQVYYTYMAYRLNPLSAANKEKYIASLCFARYFKRLEMLLSQESSLSSKQSQLLLYAAGRNGNIHKYKQQLSRRSGDNRTGELALLLFTQNHLTNPEKHKALNRYSEKADPFLQQEILVAQAELYLAGQDPENAEKSLLQAYKLNEYAFAPALGRFYARYRNLGKALQVFEKHLALYHDPSVAVQAAEIYCLLNRTDKIAKLRTEYQGDSGSRGMLCSYYFDALIALAENKTASLQKLLAPLRGNLDTPLAAFMFLCADLQSGSIPEIRSSYEMLLAHRNYLNLQEQADNLLTGYLKNAFLKKSVSGEKLLPLSTLLYQRKPDLFVAKILLLTQKKNNAINIVLLKDALKRFGKDQGVIKIAIEYYLQHSLEEAEHLIAYYKQNFAQKSGDMVRYEIMLNLQKKDHEKVSALFRNNFKAELRPDYWQFASRTMREADLKFLSRDPLYKPFCQALLHLKRKEVGQACELLEQADAGKMESLLFFAAKILAENGRNQAALKKYALFPEKSPYALAVLLNKAELYGETGRIDRALILAARAYNLAPQMPETQLCYADKLYKKGDRRAIPDIIKLSSSSTYRRKLEPFWIAGMEQRIRDCNIRTQREKIRELCRQLLVIAPGNNIALETLKKLHPRPQ